MKAAPIIHTRTFSCDFNAEFLVRPERFKDSDIKWARKNVLGATGEIDGIQGFRWLIADNDNYRMAGVVGFLKNISAKCRMTEDARLKSETLFCDDKGRLVYAFIGLVIDKHQSDDYGAISLEYLWNMYLEIIYPIWKRTYQEVILENFMGVNTKVTNSIISSKYVMTDSMKLFEANSAIDYELFLNYLCNKNESNFSFCSNVLDFNMVKQSDFSIITTSQNVITRIMREKSVKPNSVSNELQTENASSVKNFEPRQSIEIKKKVS